MIAESVDRFGDRPLIEGDRHRPMLTYRTAWGWAEKAARNLARAGAGRGDRVVVRAPKSVESLIAYLAALRLGAIWVPVSPDATTPELDHVIDDAEPRVVIDGDRAITDLVGERRSGPASTPVQPPSRHGVASLGGGEIAALLYTSGTTGRPKGVPISGAALSANSAALVEAWAFTADDVLIHALPTHHAHGLFVALGCAITSGASLRWVDRFDAGVVAGLFPGATAFMGVPTHYVRLLEEPRFNHEACTSIRLLTSGSAPLPAVVFDRVAERTGVEVVERYGMTETLMLTSNPLDGPRKPGSVGTPLPGVEVRLGPIGDAAAVRSDPDATTDTDTAVGMVEVRGPSVFDQYRGRGADRSKPDHPGDATWFRTGDLGRWDVDGYLFLVGRSNDLIISGGLNVYPAEVEAVLDRHPAVAEVAVIGLPDDHWGQVVAAIVVASPTHLASADLGAELIEAARAELSAYKLPRRIQRADTLPRNAMGKVDKVALRHRYRDH